MRLSDPPLPGDEEWRIRNRAAAERLQKMKKDDKEKKKKHRKREQGLDTDGNDDDDDDEWDVDSDDGHGDGGGQGSSVGDLSNADWEVLEKEEVDPSSSPTWPLAFHAG